MNVVLILVSANGFAEMSASGESEIAGATRPNFMLRLGVFDSQSATCEHFLKLLGFAVRI